MHGEEGDMKGTELWPSGMASHLQNACYPDQSNQSYDWMRASILTFKFTLFFSAASNIKAQDLTYRFVQLLKFSTHVTMLPFPRY